MIAGSVTLQIFEALAASLAGPAMPAILIARSIHFRRTPPSCREPGALGLGLFGTETRDGSGPDGARHPGSLGAVPGSRNSLEALRFAPPSPLDALCWARRSPCGR